MLQDRPHELAWPNGYGAPLLRRAPRSLGGDCESESRLKYLLRMASILSMLTSLHFQYAWRESPAAAGTRQAHTVRPTNLLIIFLLKVLESNFPGKPPINLHGHENSHTLELRVCLSQTLSETHSLSRRTGRRHRGHVSLAASTTDKQ